MSKKTSYINEQMIHTLSNNGESQRKIAEALEIPRRTVRNVLGRDPRASEDPEIVGDGCSYLLSEGGAVMPQSTDVLTPLDIEELDLNVSDHPTGQLRNLDSGYPDITYDERHKKYEVWIHGRRIWRASKLTKACEVRLSKGSLSKDDEELLQSVVNSPIDVQEALNSPPI